MEEGMYHSATTAIALGQVATACLATEGFTSPCATDAEPYLEYVPQTPEQGLKKLSQCGTEENAYCYSSDTETFHVQFELESANAQLGLQKGLNCLTENGFATGACAAYASEEEGSDDTEGETTTAQ